MYRVAICDDEKVISEEQEKICRDILHKLNIDYHIATFGNGNSVIKKIMADSGESYDLYLLDIMMDGMDGMELAKQIRASDKNAAIVFITSTPDYVFKGYDVNALHYLMKPLERNALEKLILSDYSNRTKRDFIVFESGAGKYRAAKRDIIYLETAGRQVAITLRDRMIYYSGKLSDLLLMLPKDQFVRCHQSFAVNISNIRELNRYYVVTVSGQEIPISRSFLTDVRKAFVQHVQEC